MQSQGDHTPRSSDALIVVDVQNDFLPGGALAVPHGDRVIAPMNRYIGAFRERGLPIFAPRDWHPEDHCSFQAQGGPWPPHCIAGTPGAEFPSALELPDEAVVISKATAPDLEAYSGFAGTDLARRLREAGVGRVFVGGLATDYCVQATVTDALKAGFEVFVLSDAVRAVDVHPGDGQRALEAMRRAGAVLTDLGAVGA
jgi:nicotinamidase/pyrazinamidase